MFGKDKHEKKKRKYGKTVLKPSTMGRNSCILAGISVTLFVVGVIIAYIMRGKTIGIVGGLGVIAIIAAGLGCRAAMKGFRERERRYLNCKIGMTLNILILIGLLIIFIGGLV